MYIHLKYFIIVFICISWITTGQNKPVQMWDAFDGSLRCSYRGYNAVDEVEAAISICFSNNASQIHAGYKKSIKTFDVERYSYLTYV